MIRRDLTTGERAGLAGGEREARKHDVFLARPQGWRNQVWEADHVQAPVRVDVEGAARRPWVTWFLDGASNTIMGVVVTPRHPARGSVLAALRAAVVREEPFGPQGGLPEKARVDRGKDFLSRTVTAASNALDVTVEDLPAYTPHQGHRRGLEPGGGEHVPARAARLRTPAVAGPAPGGAEGRGAPGLRSFHRPRPSGTSSRLSAFRLLYRTGPHSSTITVGSDRKTSRSTRPYAMLNVSSQYDQPRIPRALVNR